MVKVLELNEWNETFAVDILQELFLNERRMVLFYLDGMDLYDSPLHVIYGHLNHVGLGDDCPTISSIIAKINPDSEVCEVMGYEAFVQSVHDKLHEKQAYIAINFPILHKDKRWINITLKKLSQKGIVLGSIEDISKQNLDFENIYYTLYKDQLTGLFNDATLRSHLEKMKEDTEHYIGFIDLDNFKRINDQYTHAFGNEILRTFGQIMIDLCDDKIICYRVSGDEFAFLTREMSRDDVEHFIERLRNEFMKHSMGDLVLSCSAGYVKYKSILFKIPDEVLSYADLAMYKAKAKQRGTTCFLSEEEILKIKDKGLLISQLKYFSGRHDSLK